MIRPVLVKFGKMSASRMEYFCDVLPDNIRWCPNLWNNTPEQPTSTGLDSWYPRKNQTETRLSSGYAFPALGRQVVIRSFAEPTHFESEWWPLWVQPTRGGWAELLWFGGARHRQDGIKGSHNRHGLFWCHAPRRAE
jgi:hypothetical protein